MCRMLFAFGFLLAITAPAAGVLIGNFPGIEALVAKADAIVILRIDRHIQPEADGNLLSTHECFIYQTLKGDILKDTTIKLRLMDTRSSFASPFAFGSSHLIFLVKKQSGDEPTDYRTLPFEGANIRLGHLGHEKMPEGKTVVEQVRTVIKEAADVENRAHEKEDAFLSKVLGGQQSAESYEELPSFRRSKDKPALKKRIESARAEIARRHKGHIIVGRVQVEGRDDPRDVRAQMEILADGSFAGVTKDLRGPVGFRMHGYPAFDLPLNGGEGLYLDVGTIEMKRLPESALVQMEGRIELEGGGDPSAVSIGASAEEGAVNTPSGGTSGRPHWPEPIALRAGADGRFQKNGFSPINYYVSFTSPGYVSQSRRVKLDNERDRKLGEIRLEQPRGIAVDYVTSKNNELEFANVQHTRLQGGDHWSIWKRNYGWDLEFQQTKGELHFHWSYGPVFLSDLGSGELNDFSNVDAATAQQDPKQVPVKSGHVYILRTWGRKSEDNFALFKIETEDAPVASGTAKPKQTKTEERPLGKTEVKPQTTVIAGDLNRLDGEGFSQLHRAAMGGNVARVRELIGKGANVNVQQIKFFGTPLQYAAAQGHGETVQALLEAGAKPDARDAKQRTPLMWAAQAGQADVIRRLLKFGADVNAATESGWTPLHYAVSKNHVVAAELLMDQGADVLARNSAGKIAFEINPEWSLKYLSAPRP
jgi:hypothetical protein